MSDSSTSSTPLLVACLCAEWCSICREYRSVFEAAAQGHPDMRFVWVDIEEESDLVDPLEVENFPTLLLADAGGPSFFGPVLPHKDTLWRLLRSGREGGQRGACPNADVRTLVARLRAKV